LLIGDFEYPLPVTSSSYSASPRIAVLLQLLK
jgi:hypothetical protein